MAKRTGRLTWSETGRVLLEHNEEVSRWRQARKTFTVHVGEPQGELWLLVGEYEGNTKPLVVRVNGRRTTLKPTGRARGLHWERVNVPRGALKRGRNEVILSTSSDRPATWILGAVPVRDAGTSALSLDGGQTWYTDGMGVYALTPAEYVVRLWVDNAPAAPNTPYQLIRERPDHPQLKALVRHFRLRETVSGTRHTYDRVRALMTRVARLWKVGQAPPGHGYNCPWDTFTIAAWMDAGSVQQGLRPVAYCVHFGIIMVQFCTALGMVARNVVMEDDIPECKGGHFTCEVWVPEWDKWIHVDPDHDACYEAGGAILSMAELSDACLSGRIKEVNPLHGPAYGYDPRLNTAKPRAYERHQQFRRWGVYPRTDYASNPAAHPIQHGTGEYRQTHFLWFDDARLERRRYFPHYTNDLAALYAPPA